MPDITREQFDAAARKVADTAPAGLSRDDFFKLIDQELAKLPPAGGTVIGDVRRGATPIPTDKDPSAAGFFRNMVTDAASTGWGLLKAIPDLVSAGPSAPKMIAEGLIHRAKEVAGDIHPLDAIEQIKQGRPMAALGNILPVGQAYEKPASMAADIYGGGQLLKLGKTIARNIPRPAPSVTGETVDETLPHGAKEGEIIPERTPQPSMVGSGEMRRLPAGRPPVLDEKGRDIAPAQNEPTARPAGPWDENGSNRPPIQAQVATIDPEEAAYQGLLNKVGGKGEPNEGWGPKGWGDLPRDWHAFESDEARAAASPAERQSATATHKYLGEMDSRYKHLTDPDYDLGAFTPEGLLAKLMLQLFKERMAAHLKAPPSPDWIGRTAAYGKEGAKLAIPTAAVGRLMRPEER